MRSIETNQGRNKQGETNKGTSRETLAVLAPARARRPQPLAGPPVAGVSCPAPPARYLAPPGESIIVMPRGLPYDGKVPSGPAHPWHPRRGEGGSVLRRSPRI